MFRIGREFRFCAASETSGENSWLRPRAGVPNPVGTARIWVAGHRPNVLWRQDRSPVLSPGRVWQWKPRATVGSMGCLCSLVGHYWSTWGLCVSIGAQRVSIGFWGAKVGLAVFGVGLAGIGSKGVPGVGDRPTIVGRVELGVVHPQGPGHPETHGQLGRNSSPFF